MIIFVIPQWLDFCHGECYKNLRIGVSVICHSLAQLSLITLLLLPLRKHRQENHAAVDNLVPIMMRVAILTGICLLTDITTTVLSVIYEESAYSGLNIVSNVFCLIFSTADWRERLWPFWKSTIDPVTKDSSNLDKVTTSNSELQMTETS